MMTAAPKQLYRKNKHSQNVELRQRDKKSISQTVQPVCPKAASAILWANYKKIAWNFILYVCYIN